MNFVLKPLPGDVLCEMGSDHFCMERERTASEHFHISRNGAINVYGRHHAFMATVGSWTRRLHERYTQDQEGQTAMCRLRT